MSLLLQPFHQQTLGTFDRDARDPAVRVQPLVEIAESGDVVREPALMNQPARRIQDAEWCWELPQSKPMNTPSPVVEATFEESNTGNILPRHVTVGLAVLEPHHGARSATPAGVNAD